MHAEKQKPLPENQIIFPYDEIKISQHVNYEWTLQHAKLYTYILHRQLGIFFWSMMVQILHAIKL